VLFSSLIVNQQDFGKAFTGIVNIPALFAGAEVALQATTQSRGVLGNSLSS
jgi:hypothetical protein